MYDSTTFMSHYSRGYKMENMSGKKSNYFYKYNITSDILTLCGMVGYRISHLKNDISCTVVQKITHLFK